MNPSDSEPQRPWSGGEGGPPGWPTDHPAVRPGTGLPVVWHNQVHVISPTKRCLACGLYADQATAGECYCGARNWLSTGPRQAPPHAQEGPRATPAVPLATYVAAAHVPSSVVVDYEGARLNELLGGIKKGALLLVVGAAGAGKSTSCAELSAIAARFWSRPERGAAQQPDCKIYWIDSDQKDASLVRECFDVANVVGAFVHRVRLLPERREPFSFDEALRVLPEDARVLVLDSLEKWGASDTERLAILDRLRAHPAWLKLVISGTNKLGGVSGVGALERANDAIIYAERTADARYTLRFTKRRWRPCASARARGAGQAGAGQERPAKAQASPPDVAQAEPIEAPESYEPSNDPSTRAEAAASAQLDSADIEIGRLPERMEAPYALLLRSWLWTEGVRVTTIVAAWHFDPHQFEELGRALRELTHTTDGSIPSALRIGNALRWVRGHTIDGMTLTCERDRRTKIATWCVVRMK